MRPGIAYTVLAFSILLSVNSYGDEASELETIKLQDLKSRLEKEGKLKNTIIHTEVVSSQKIEKKQATNLSQAISNEPGVEPVTGCSICGIKKIQINGLRGEYTTVLVDDIPIYSMVSSFYGMDALTLAGVSQIEIARGTGASLLAPGAIGGVINVITKKAQENSIFVDVAGGNGGYRTFSVVGQSVSQDATLRTTIAAQYSGQAHWDADNNGISESPFLRNYSVMARASQDLGKNDNLDFRLAALKNETQGGPILENFDGAKISGTTATFEGGDVRKRFNGELAGMLESIQIERIEGIGKWTHRLSEDSNLSLAASYATQAQDSYYEGSDYYNSNQTYFVDGRWNYSINPQLLFVTGFSARKETLRSESVSFFQRQRIAKDDFDHWTLGPYAQITWTPVARFEASLANRVDYLNVDWLGQGASGSKEIDKWLNSPRLHMRYNFAEHWTTRLGAGYGYRVPLTFFESEHGILNKGFEVKIQDPETAQSVFYSLGFENEDLVLTGSASWANLDRPAYIETSGTRPELVNYAGKVDVFSADIVAGYRLTNSLAVGASYEHFFYPSEYKRLLTIPASEDRVKLNADFEQSWGLLSSSLTWVGSRQLSEYYSGERYNVYNGAPSEPKMSRVPYYFVWDLRFSYRIRPKWDLYIGLKNILDTTQAKTENALFWESNGDLDVTHIWGPLRGREFYVGLRATL